jgi:hypothetical protein
MSKLFWSTVLITSVATGLGFIPVARSQTTGTNTLSQFPIAPNPQAEPPVCFFTSTGGRTFDLEALCGASNPSNNATDANNPSAAPLNTPSDDPASNNSPSNNPPIISSPTQTSGETDLGPLTKPAINLPNVPPSAFSPGGVTPTRQSIDGNNQE